MESPGVGFGPAGKGASPCQVSSPLRVLGPEDK